MTIPPYLGDGKKVCWWVQRSDDPLIDLCDGNLSCMTANNDYSNKRERSSFLKKQKPYCLSLYFYDSLSPEADSNPWLQQSLTAARKKKCSEFYCAKSPELTALDAADDQDVQSTDPPPL